MPVTILKHIKGSDLPDSWKKKIKADSKQTYKITIESEKEYEDEEMPPEEMFSDELIASVKRSEEDCKAGRYTRCKTKEEDDAFFNKVWNE